MPRFFKPTSSLPNAEETGLSASVVKANEAVKAALRDVPSPTSKKRKYSYTTTFTPKD